MKKGRRRQENKGYNTACTGLEPGGLAQPGALPETPGQNDRAKVEELYDLEADVGERTNLAAKHPQKVAELRELMRSIEARDKLAPSDNNR